MDFQIKDRFSDKLQLCGYITAQVLPGGHVVFGLPSISGANQKRKINSAFSAPRAQRAVKNLK
jgi:hypothetical protein